MSQTVQCDQCGATDATVYFPGAGCTKCESPRPKVGEMSDYCKDMMHFHCAGEFDWDCGCGCHEQFDLQWDMQKPMTEEYFLEMVNRGKFSWIQLAHIYYDPKDYNRRNNVKI